MQVEPDFFTILPEDKVPEVGKILISEPFMADVFFNRAVIYIVGHSKEASIGFILNKRLDIQVCEAVSGFDNCFDLLSIGGPVSPTSLHYIHKKGDLIPNSVKVDEGVYWGGDIDVVRDLVKNNKLDSSEIRFFLGFSGWSEGQLDKELQEDSWVITKPTVDIIFHGGDADAWKSILRNFRKKYRIWADFPESPELN